MSILESGRVATEAIDLLKRIIAVPSVSRQEREVSELVGSWLRGHGIDAVAVGLNLVALAQPYDASRPTLMLNSHLDTVPPPSDSVRDPFTPFEQDGRIYGRGSNDAGASVVALIAAYRLMLGEQLPYNLMLALSVEEEVGGEGGMRMLLPALEQMGMSPSMAIVGEPTGMQPGFAERGLVVLDCETRGLAGHAARNEGINAIYRAIADIETLRNFRFEKESEVLGPVKISITGIEGGKKHNLVPDLCKWFVDVRTTDAYSNEQTARMLAEALSEHTSATPRSTRVQASVLDACHPLMLAAEEMGLAPFVSPTTSDMSLMHGIPSLKIGPGESARSHTADEYVLRSEIEEAVPAYVRFLRHLAKIIER